MNQSKSQIFDFPTAKFQEGGEQVPPIQDQFIPFVVERDSLGRLSNLMKKDHVPHKKSSKLRRR